MAQPKLISLALLAAGLLLAVPVQAQSGAAVGGGTFHVDFEVDPTAYVLSGHSLHVGLGYGRARLDLGNFAMSMPRFMHGADGFDVSFQGYGLKLQYFFQAEPDGFFAGVDAGLARVLAERHDTALAARDAQLSVGAHVGYRVPIAGGFYITPWIGVGYSFGVRAVTLAGATYEASPFSVFPAIHVGYRAF